MTVTSVETDYDNLAITLIAEFDDPIDRVWELWSDPRQLEIKAITALVLQRYRLEAPIDYDLEIRMMPTLSPKRGLPLRVAEMRAA